ncbi:hypothetical protein BC939DRAFT_468738 [Gamsiella multidivaricata]|uniref:uncharacterized protein n=1 Tax=Gamsiella multidivaricata TaxID=101098 RepID=UPI002220BC48|nr:uncharacterized protein BC939DRAFT_468738 [Gamsiella multidivaricata]KAG0368079.1 E3 UFM1-protein ligase 1 [Gamsiella multidivaricata]KAI7816540.1 hypothetical protein BC939DRAFT_468738 [Gamsiella multidivaricata]
MASAIWKTFFGTRDNPEDLLEPASLSEDACGSLVHSLVRLGYLANISLSLDGKSFITHEQLIQDILIQLKKRHGRVSLLDMPKVLNASLSDIEDRIKELVRAKPGTVVLVQDELLQMEYLDSMTEQMTKELDQQGYLTIADLCRKHKLAIDFMRQFLKDRVGGVIPGQWDTIDRGVIISPSFLEKEKTTLLKILDELEEPTSLQSLRSRHVVQDQLFYGLCDLLSREGGLPGLFKGTNEQGVFVPRPYEQHQTEWIETFFKNNGFIEFDSVKKRGMADPKAYVQTNHPIALLLETHAVKDSIWSIIDASVEDTISNLSWIDVKPLLPSPLTKDDIASLLRQLPSLAEPTFRIAISPDQDQSLTGYGGGSPQETFIIQDSIVITSGQLQKCLLKMGPLLDRSLKNMVSWRLSFGTNEQLEGQDPDNENRVSNFGERVSHFKGVMEHAFNAHPGPQRKNIKHAKGSAGKQDGTKKQIQDFLTIQDVREEIKKLEPDFDPVLVSAVSGALYRDLVENLRDRNRSMVLNQVQEVEKEEDDLVKHDVTDTSGEGVPMLAAIRSLSKRIELSSTGIDIFEDPSAKNSLSKYLLQSWCVELLDLITLYLSDLDKTSSIITPSDAIETRERVKKAYNEFQSQSNNASSIQGPFVISVEDRIALLKLVPQDKVEPLEKMRKLTAGSGKQKNLAEYVDMLSFLFRDENLDLKATGTGSMDNSQWRREHVEELRNILIGIHPFADPALMLHIVTLIVFQKWTGRMLHASGKHVPRTLRQLRLSVEQQRPPVRMSASEQEVAILQLNLLEEMLSLVLSSVKQQQQEASEHKGAQEDSRRSWQAVYDLGVMLSSSMQ